MNDFKKGVLVGIDVSMHIFGMVVIAVLAKAFSNTNSKLIRFEQYGEYDDGSKDSIKPSQNKSCGKPKNPIGFS